MVAWLTVVSTFNVVVSSEVVAATMPAVVELTPTFIFDVVAVDVGSVVVATVAVVNAAVLVTFLPFVDAVPVAFPSTVVGLDMFRPVVIVVAGAIVDGVAVLAEMDVVLSAFIALVEVLAELTEFAVVVLDATMPIVLVLIGTEVDVVVAFNVVELSA